MRNHNLGIMQGRLTPSLGRGIQFFPFDTWQREFELAQQIGLDEIEWIFDFDSYEKNPLYSAGGRREIRELADRTGVKVNTICFDYFMRRAFFKAAPEKEELLLQENERILETILKASEEIGARLVEIPLVDDSRVEKSEERKKTVLFLRRMAKTASRHGQLLGLETDFPPGEFRAFLEEIGCDNIRANYDSGNSSGLGYDPREEISSLKDLIQNVHIKDRLFGGGSVALGTGSADLAEIFASLRQQDYRGSFILQAARGEDGCEQETVRTQMELVEAYLKDFPS